MNKIIANQKNGNIEITGYMTGVTIVIEPLNISIKSNILTSINEQELNGVLLRLISQLLPNDPNDPNERHTAMCKALKDDNFEIDFSTEIDIEGIRGDLKRDEEAKINVTGDSKNHIDKLISEIRANVVFDEIVVSNEKNRKKRVSTYIRIYA